MTSSTAYKHPSLDTALPEGTVTVLSTDLEGSTALNQRLGDEVATALEREIADLANTHIDKQRGRSPPKPCAKPCARTPPRSPSSCPSCACVTRTFATR